MRLHIPKRQPAVKKKYEYFLPDDAVKVTIDAIALAQIICMRDFAGALTLAREAVAEVSRVGCEQMKTTTRAEELTNKFEFFLGLWTAHFTKAYLDQQTRYQQDHARYLRDKKVLDEIGMERSFVLKQEALARAADSLQAMMGEDSGFK